MKSTVRLLLLALTLIPALAAARQQAAPNTLHKAEKAAGWKLLFDGKTTQGWRGFRRDQFPTSGWAIENGTIKHLSGEGAQSQQGGDIITVGEYDNFELRLEWQLDPRGHTAH